MSLEIKKGEKVGIVIHKTAEDRWDTDSGYYITGEIVYISATTIALRVEISGDGYNQAKRYTLPNETSSLVTINIPFTDIKEFHLL